MWNKLVTTYCVALLAFLVSWLIYRYRNPGYSDTMKEPEFVYPDVFNDPDRDAFIYGKFPDGFAWSSATAAYQIEGGWDADGKGPSIWDTWSHEAGGHMHDNVTGDVACDSYNKYKEDVQLMVDIGLNFYRFSISWPRLLPDGTIDNKNPAGLQYYNNLINELLDNNITPMVTLYHWDLPQALQDVGGWANETVIDHFNNYAEYCFNEFGDRVKFWLTFNEPLVIIHGAYENGWAPPGLTEQLGTLSYIVAHNVIKSHARAWHNYNDNFRNEQGGKCGITLDCPFFTPLDPDDPADVEAAQTSLQFQLGWLASPIYKTGHYPDVMRTKVDSKSALQGYEESRLPKFTDEEAEYIRGTSDYFGLNHYTTRYIEDNVQDITAQTSFHNDQDIKASEDDIWPRAQSVWLRVVPWGLRGVLNWIKTEYGDVDIYITENGFSTADIFDQNDEDRIKFYKAYINEVLKAITIDGVNVKGYTAWSLLDNLEWVNGYSERFGLHYVNFTDPDRPRVPKDSAKAYAKIVADNGFIAK